MDILLFGDQSGLNLEVLGTTLRKTQGNKLLSIFVKETVSLLRQEAAKIPKGERDPIPEFSSLDELRHWHTITAVHHPAIDAALTCISHFLDFFQYYHHASTRWPGPGDRIIGLCIGSLTAAAVASATSLDDLLPLAVETVGVAFRVGLRASEIARLLSTAQKSSEPWSHVIIGLDKLEVELAIEDYAREHDLSKAATPYLSAIGPKTVTVSGEPTILDGLFQDGGILYKAIKKPLRLYAPYHSPAIYRHANASLLVLGNGTKVRGVLEGRQAVTSLLLEPHTQESSAEASQDLFVQSCQHILSDTLRLDLLVSSAVAEAAAAKIQDVQVVTFGPTDAASALVSALQSGRPGTTKLVEASGQRTATSSEELNGPSASSKIAIIGMAGRFPGGSNVDEFWKVIEQGLDVHKEVPKDRFDATAHVDADGKRLNTSHTPFGCFIDNPGLFDPRFFNMSPREAAQTDPMQRLALVTAFEALEQAGFVPNRTPSSALDRVGTFYGQTSDDYREINAAQAIDTYFITGGIRAFGPGRINYHFKFRGPSYNVDTACSSSLAAIQLACTSLWGGECDTAVAGGLSILTSPDLFAGLSRGQFLSKTGSCKTFDNAADGYCRGDSVGTVILKRLDDAILDNDNVLGVITGAATNHSADAISITHPHAQTQEALYRRVLAQAGLDPAEIDVAEMHGTGTQAGDGAEMESISNILAPAQRRRGSNNPLYVGSVKANVGHGEAASGVTALIKSLLMFRNNLIPPHAGIKGLINQGFPNLEQRNIQIALSRTPFQAQARKRRRMLVNNFSAAGGNTALILEDFAERGHIERDSRAAFPVVVSAKAEPSLQANVDNLLTYLGDNPNTTLADLSYTTTARRTHHDLRIAVTGSSVEQIKRLLKLSARDGSPAGQLKPSKIAFAFTGQGAYYESLGRDLLTSSPKFNAAIKELDSLLRIHDLPSVLEGLQSDPDQNPARSPTQVQLLLVAIQLALCKLWASLGVSAEVVVGHSLGEYAALYAAGVLSASDALYLVGRRAQLLEKHCSQSSHGMLAVRNDLTSIQNILKENDWNLDIACVNGPSDIVLSGESSVIARAQETITARGHKCTKLDVPFAFHSSQIDQVRAPFEDLARYVTFNKPRIHVISPLLSDVVHQSGVVNSNYLGRHARETVDFHGAIQKAQHLGVINDATGWLELGPHPICLAMVKSTVGTRFNIASLRRKEDAWETLSKASAELYTHGINVDWDEFHRDHAQCHRLLDLPAYAFDEKNYWLEYKNNWSLSKGHETSTEQETNASYFTPTTTLQRIVKEDFSDTNASVTFESDFSDPMLHSAVLGHLVNDSGLCPSSIYADMAFTAARHVHSRLFLDDECPGMNVRAMEVSKPVIVSPKVAAEPHLLHVTATTDASRQRVDLEYNSIDIRNRSTISNAHCIVEYEEAAEWQLRWTRNAYLIESRIKTLQSEALSGNVQRILSGMAYKLFSALVQYSDAYRGMQEVLLLSSQREATARVKFQADEKNGTFVFSPYWIDSLAHLSGFVLNANDAVDSKSHVFISHGWESMRFGADFSAAKTYRTYVKMQGEAKSTIMSGDVYVFEEGQVVGLVEGLKFQQVPRVVLDHLLPPAKKAPTAKPPTLVPTPAPATVKKAAEAMAKSPPALAPDPGMLEKVGKIIATEVGIAVHELQENVGFAELGVDSLLSLTITGRLREELDLPLPATLFGEYATWRALQTYLEKLPGQEGGGGPTTTSALPSRALETVLAANDPPELTNSSEPHSRSETASADDQSTTADTVRTIVAEQMGFDPDELATDAALSTLGMDSLMTLTVVGALREKTGLDVPQALLADNPTIKDLEQRLCSPPAVSEVSHVQVSSRNDALEDVAPYYPPASSILLQGSVKDSSHNLFLFPDGSGSATSYAAVPTLLSGLAVYGLNSPFIKSPRDYTCGISGIAQIYITEIKRRQPLGPYLLGGWSVGGVIAYEAAYQLTLGGEKVEQLIMIDAPCPLLLPPLPVSLVRFFDSLGLFGQGESPPWLLEHFDSSVANLHRYKPLPIEASRAPRSCVIWARDGVCGDPLAPRPGLRVEESKSKKWILDDRQDFGPNSWDELVGEDNISGVGVPGNHFTMMQEPNVAQMAQQVRYALSKH